MCVLCVVCVSIHSINYRCQQLSISNVLRLCEWWAGCGFRGNCCRDMTGSVATGVAVSPLLLDDDSLVIASIVRRLHYLLILLSLSFSVRRDAHTRLIGLRARERVTWDEGLKQRLNKNDNTDQINNWYQELIVMWWYYLHGVDNDGEGRVVPLAAALFSPTPGTFATAMDGADSENAKDDHDNQEAHTHHNDDGSRSWHHCNRKAERWSYRIHNPNINPNFSW